MIAHVVLFRPKPDLSAEQRESLVQALDRALSNIPQIKRATVGRRIRLGQLYEEHNRDQFPYMAILEFDDEAAVRDYLEHPAHRALGEQFYTTSEAALAFDFDLLEPGQLDELLVP